MSVSERFMTAMELPGDLSCKAPIITITGPSQVQIENYKSILSYTSEKLIVVTCQGRVILQGKNLEIFHYTTWEMEIKGQILSVMLERVKNHSRSLPAPVCGIFHLNSVAVRQYIVNPI